MAPEMGQTERIYQIKRWLDAGQCLTRQTLMTRLEVSLATVKRDIAHLRDRLNAPVLFDRERSGWYLDKAAAPLDAPRELPGLWLREDEIHALRTMQHLLADIDTGGLLAPHIAPLKKRLTKMLDTGVGAPADFARRIRVHAVGARAMNLPHFQAVGHALLLRQRLRIDYHGRARDQRQAREVSPQRLNHYRGNWYLDAWCHLRQALRSFSVDAMHAVQTLQAPAIDVPDAELDDFFGGGYGIFSGHAGQRARLRFSAARARWVASERWHPEQQGRFDDEGRWVLDLPYADPRELVMDILRHVPDVEVLWPEELAQEVRHRLSEGLRRMACSAG
jgi:predicted DNA-binding transcriptional regulator YafY